MKLLLIVGHANDVFIYNMAKWLKKTADIDIDVFEFFPSEKQCFDNKYYNIVEGAKGLNIPIVKLYANSYIESYQLKKFLRNRYYDIIHCHWIVSALVQTVCVKKHCRKLVITFWGGEFVSQKILRSKKLYYYYLNRFSSKVDCIINDREGIKEIIDNLPMYKGKVKSATLGSAPLETLYDLMEKESRFESKIRLKMPTDKYIVLIGYSGKALHRHIPIIQALSNNNSLKTKIHLFAPMTRGANSKYVTEVDNELKNSGFSYTLFRDRFLTDEEMGRVRNATDIVMQLSEFDGFSRSIIECLCAKSILIYGNWLGYEKYMSPVGFQGIEVQNIEDGVSKLENVISYIDNYNTMLNDNNVRGRSRALWSECIKDWSKAYNDLLE